MTEKPSFLRSFLGVRKVQALFDSLAAETRSIPEPEANTFALLAVLGIATTPIVINALDISVDSSVLPSLPTVAIGVCALLALLLRGRLGIHERPVSQWSEAFRNTHTAFALGCIPTVAVLALWPTLLADRHDLLRELSSATPTPAIEPSLFSTLLVVFCMAAWIAVTEEVLFRGGFLSVIRRWRVVRRTPHRDTIAVVVSSLLFGVAHFALWGWPGAVAMTGLGCGLALGYLANGERLLPVIVYHFAFDTLSILASTVL